MHRAVLILLLALLAGPMAVADGAQAAPRLPFEVGDLALANGRTLRSVVVLSQTASSINVRHAGGLTKIEKRDLPPELLVRFPVNDAQAAKDQEAASRDRAQREEKALAAGLWVVRPGQPGTRAAPSLASDRETANPKDAAKTDHVASPADQLARAPKGLYIATWSNLNSGEIKLEVINPTSTAQKIDARDLVALRLDNGRSVPGGDVRFPVQERADLWVDAGKRRTFRVQFLGGVSIAAIAWVGSSEWRVSGPSTEAAAVTSEDEAMTLARANDKEAKDRARMEANKSRAAKAIDKLDDRLIGK
jgi:hypothetical protein